MKIKTNNKLLTLSIISLVLIISIFIIKNHYFNSDYISSQNQNIDMKDEIKDERILKIIDIHENLSNYIGKEEKIIAQYIEFDDGYAIGIEHIFDNNEIILFDILADYSNVKLPKDLSVFDWIEVTGNITSYEENHEGHIHFVPYLKVSSLKKFKL